MTFGSYFKLFQERAYHGTPHKITDKFDLKYINTGEGAQAYGWGLYFAEKEDVADSYRHAHAHKKINPTTKEGVDIISPDEAKEFIRQNGFVWAYDHDSEWIQIRSVDSVDYYEEYRTGAKFAKSVKKTGNLYHVEIDVKDEELLDWDSPLSEQSNHVRTQLHGPWMEDFFGHYWHDFADGAGCVMNPDGGRDEIIMAYTKDDLEKFLYGPAKNFYYWTSKILESKKEASLFLLRQKIKGIKYWDQNSRLHSNGTRNFVIFDDSLVTITKDIP